MTGAIRKWRSRFGIAAFLCAVLLVLYPLSIGPSVAVLQMIYPDYLHNNDAGGAMSKIFETVYQPLISASDGTRGRRWLAWYMRCCVRDDPPADLTKPAVMVLPAESP